MSTSRAKTDAICIMQDMRDDRDTSWIFNITSVSYRHTTDDDPLTSSCVLNALCTGSGLPRIKHLSIGWALY